MLNWYFDFCLLENILSVWGIEVYEDLGKVGKTVVEDGTSRVSKFWERNQHDKV